MQFAIIPLIVIMMASTLPASAVEWKFNFSNALPPEITLEKAALDGSCVLADFSASEDEWHEFLSTRPEVKFKKGKTYHVSFDYEILDAGKGKTQFYSLLRSRNGDPDIYGENWLWNRWTGAKGTIDRIFKPAKDGYYLIIGVRHAGAMKLSSLTISEVSGSVPGTNVKVKNQGNEVLKACDELAAEREKGKMRTLLKQMLVVVCDEGAHPKSPARKDEIVRTLNPDFVDWSPFGPLAKDYGIRITKGGPEYQEYYKFEGPEHWDKRYETFTGSGFSESLDGTILQDQTWGEGGYYTCHNGENWHKFFVDRILVEANEYAGICQDNIGTPPFYKGGGCFCAPCESRFRNYLEERYYGEELSKLGIDDIDKFSIKNRVLTYGLVGIKALDDPVVREYIKFQFKTQLLAWVDCVKQIKEQGKKQGREIPVYGNQIGAQGFWPYAAIVGQFNDIIQIEEVIGMSDDSEIERCSLHYKMGRAVSHEQAPVWVRGPVVDGGKKESPYMNPLYWKVRFAEALANGGIRDISLGVNTPWTGKPGTLDYIDSPELWKVWKSYSSFVNKSRAILSERKSLARVALVYSLPTVMFRRYYPLQIDDNSYFQAFNKAAKMLEREHIPFDVVIFGHPEMFATDMASLKRYDALVMPGCDALSDIQAAGIKDFVKRGGKLVTSGDIATRDENLNKRPASALKDVPSIDLQDTVKVSRALKSLRPATVGTNSDVSVNVWLSANKKSCDVHLVNYGADLKAGAWKPLKPFKLSVTLPQGFKFGSATLRTMDGEMQQLSYEVKNGKAQVTVPSFEAYAVVSFEDSTSVEMLNNELLKAREDDKQSVKEEAAQFNLY